MGSEPDLEAGESESGAEEQQPHAMEEEETCRADHESHRSLESACELSIQIPQITGRLTVSSPYFRAWEDTCTMPCSIVSRLRGG